MAVDELTDADLAEAAVETIPSDASIDTVKELARDMYARQRLIEDLEAKLEREKEELKKLAEDTLPNRMAQVGVSALELASGWRLELKPFSSCSIIEEEKQRALDWLRDNGGGDIIKNVVSVAFGRGEDEQAIKLVDHLRELNLPVTQDMNVNWQTLNAWVRAELSQGRGVPKEHFKLYTGNVAKLKPPKKK
jgi:hypothetical protein